MVTGSHSADSFTAVITADEDHSIEARSITIQVHLLSLKNPNKKSSTELVIKPVEPSGKPLQELASTN